MTARKCPMFDGLVRSVSVDVEEGEVCFVFADGHALDVRFDMNQNCCELFSFGCDVAEVNACKGKLLVAVSVEEGVELDTSSAAAVLVFHDSSRVRITASNSHNGYYAHGFRVSSTYPAGHALHIDYQEAL